MGEGEWYIAKGWKEMREEDLERERERGWK